MIDKQILEALKTKLNVGLDAVYERIKKLRESRGFTVSREQAAALLASGSGIDISKFLKPEELAELRSLQTPTPRVIEKVVRTKSVVRPQTIQLASGLQIHDPFLSDTIHREAIEMASNAYPIIYIFENSVRNVIFLVLTKSYGRDWWGSHVAKTVKDRVQVRINDESNNPWHGRRGSAPIFYTDIKDLQSIIKSNWTDFAPLFPNQNWIETRISEIERSRNIIAHNNPLAKRDFQRIYLYFQDWEKQIEAVKDKI